jgi:hypothetical protein
VAKLDQFFDVYERILPAWSGDAIAAAIVAIILMAIIF